MTNTATAIPGDDAFATLRQAMANVTFSEQSTAQDPSIAHRLIAAEEAKSEDLRRREQLERQREGFTHDMRIRRGKLRQAMEQIAAELKTEEERVCNEYGAKIAVIDRAISAHDAYLDVLKRRPMASNSETSVVSLAS